MLCRPRESIQPGSLWKALGSVAWARCWRPLLAAKSLYSCSDIYVRVGRVKSRPFTVSVGLQQWCVLSPLLFIVNISGSQLFRWRETNPDQRLCWRDSLTFFNTIQFTRFVLQQNEVCYTKYQTFNTLQQVETFKYLGVVFTCDGRRGPRRLIHGLVKLT